MSILVTGSAGFIGFHVCKKLLQDGNQVIGLDNLNNYYDPKLKKSRIDELIKISKKNKINFNFIKVDLVNFNKLEQIFSSHNDKSLKISIVIHLAAQAGVRYSIENPSAYVQSNLVGFCNIIEIAKKYNVDHFYYASSSSVYGGNKKLPFEELDNVDKPISLYAATKKSNELIAHTYSHLFNLPTTGLRFFTVYGPWGRPDMALFKFTESIISNKPIRVFNYGNMLRDFTYIDDVVHSIINLINKSSEAKNNLTKNNFQNVPYKIFNIGNSRPTKLTDYIKSIEVNLGKKADIILDEMQPGDVEATYANTKYLEQYINFRPNTSIEKGIKLFIEWYLEYYK